MYLSSWCKYMDRLHVIHPFKLHYRTDFGVVDIACQIVLIFNTLLRNTLVLNDMY